mmetsp:Transcript_21157/g.44441  ORF Transcript_21157/g.44441 Transcript_21157/m.44441 type:complete len:105 (-) Transcript_21157:392-706(-)
MMATVMLRGTVEMNTIEFTRLMITFMIHTNRNLTVHAQRNNIHHLRQENQNTSFNTKMSARAKRLQPINRSLMTLYLQGIMNGAGIMERNWSVPPVHLTQRRRR